MTKQEIRVISLSKLRPDPDHTIWDVGAGTGSLSIESALLVPDGRVVAIEKNQEAVDLLHQNRERFALDHLSIVHGEAPDVCDDLPQPDRVLIGGTGGRLRDVLGYALDVLPSSGRVVLNAVTMNTITDGFQALRDLPYKIDDICGVAIQYNDELAGYQFMKARNQVYVMTGVKP